jgi:multisubunit Na+/H+ antiporter MnhG subunit
MSRFLVILGVILLAAGLLWPWLGKIGLGRLPGDIWIERENLTVVIPLGTSLALSAVLTLILWLLGR